MFAEKAGWVERRETRASTLFDVVIYDGTSAGVAAAVQAAWMGQSVVPVTILSADAAVKITVNERKPFTDGPFLSVGQHLFAAGNPGCVVVSNEGTDGYVVVDAIQFLPAE